MTVLETKWIDSYNYMQVGYDILSQQNNQTTYRRYITLHVAGHVSWSNAVARFNNPNVEQSLSYTYYAGDYTLLSQDVTVSHDSQGEHTETISGNVTSGYVSWYFSQSVAFPKINTLTQLESFTGTSITGNFKATYTPGQYQYKLAIAIAGVKTLQVFDNYVSGTNVQFSDNAISQIRAYTTNKTITLAGILQNWSNGAYLGDSKQIEITVKTTNGVSLRVNGTWKEATPYVRVNGAWKEATPYVRVNNQWKEGI